MTDLTAVINFLLEYKFVILFYLIIILLIYVNRKKFQFEAKIIAMYRTKLGLKLMDKIGTKASGLVKVLGIVGIVIGYIGMIFIVYMILFGLYNLLFVPEAPPVLSPVLPGVKIPGSPIFVPFWHGIIALFFVIVVHEFSHGVMARAFKLKVKSSGFVMFGPIPGAFVEPDEKQLLKQNAKVQQSIYAAGPFANVLLAVIVLLISGFLLTPWLGGMVDNQGFYFDEIQEGFPAEEAGLQAGVVYNMVNDKEVLSHVDLLEELGELKPGDEISIGNENGSVMIIAAENPADPEKGYMGVMGIATKYQLKESGNKTLFNVLFWIMGLLSWTYLLSLGIGIANLLPLGPVDGGRMYQVLLRKMFKQEKADKIWKQTAKIVLFLIIILILVPIIKAII
jgi:hypothetical protein